MAPMDGLPPGFELEAAPAAPAAPIASGLPEGFELEAAPAPAPRAPKPRANVPLPTPRPADAELQGYNAPPAVAQGWAKPPGKQGYLTSLSPDEEAKFQDWVKTNGVPFDPSPTADYDMRGFWKDMTAGGAHAQTGVNANDGKLHFNDYFKTPYHESFSNESQWATPNAPTWNGQDQLVDKAGNVVFDERAKAGKTPDASAPADEGVDLSLPKQSDLPQPGALFGGAPQPAPKMNIPAGVEPPAAFDGKPISQNPEHPVPPEAFAPLGQKFEAATKGLDLKSASSVIEQNNAVVAQANQKAQAIQDAFKKQTAYLNPKASPAHAAAFNAAVEKANADLAQVRTDTDQQLAGLDVKGAAATIDKFKSAADAYKTGTSDLIADRQKNPTDYGSDDSFTGRLGEAWTRVKNGTLDGLQSGRELGFSKEEIAKYPFLALPAYQWPAQTLDTALRLPGGVIGAASGAVGGVARLTGADPNMADQAARQAEQLADFSMTPGAHPGGVPHVLPDVKAPEAGGPIRTPADMLRALDEQAARDRGLKTRAEIDDFLRQRAARETPAPLALPPPGFELEQPAPKPADQTPIKDAAPTAAAPEAVAPNPKAAEDQFLTDKGYDAEEIALLGPKARAAKLKELGFEPGLPQAEAAAGTRANPAPADNLDAAAAQVAEPTPAQAEAGNYQKGHATFEGLPITIETPKGGVRRGVSPDGTPWETTMPGHYGYVKRTVDNTAENVDVFIGDKGETGKAFIIDQHNPDTGAFDEPKVVLGVETPGQAARLYHGSFSDGHRSLERFGGVHQMSIDDFKGWLAGAKDAGKDGSSVPLAAQAPKPVQTFTTAKGSTYEVHDDATTTRTKAARDDVGHEGDSGLKERSHRTVYLDEEQARALAIPQDVRWRMVDHRDGTVSLATQRPDGKWGRAPSAANVPATLSPAVGKIPLEMWKPEYGQNATGYGKVHFGNKITRLGAEAEKSPPQGNAAGKEKADGGGSIQTGKPAEAAKVPETVPEVAWADAQPGDRLPLNRQLVAKGIRRKSDAKAMADSIPGGEVYLDGARGWGVVQPYDAAAEPAAVAKKKRPPTRRAGKPQSLVQFLKAAGGLADEGGELTARNLQLRHVALVRKTGGLDLDHARELAAEAGYLKPTHTPNDMSYTEAAVATTTRQDLLSALDAHPTYSIHDEDALNEATRKQLAKDQHEESLDDARRAIHAELTEGLGIPDALIDRDLIEQAAAIQVAEGMHPGDALEAAAIRHTVESGPEATAAYDDAGIPWDDYVEPQDAPAAGEAAESHPLSGGSGEADEEPGQARPLPDGRPQSAGAAAGGAGEPAERPRQEAGETGHGGLDTSADVLGEAMDDIANGKGNAGLLSDHRSPQAAYRFLVENGWTPFREGKGEYFMSPDGKGYAFTTTSVEGSSQQFQWAPFGGKYSPQKPAATAEPGAEGKPQLVIPGAEQIGQGEHAQMGADKPLKGKGEQKEPGGLFGDDSKQGDLMDALQGAVRDAKDIAAGELPIEDARERERLENIRKAEATGAPLVAGEPDLKQLLKALLDIARPLAEKGGLTGSEARLYEETMRRINALKFEMARPADPAKVAPESETKSTLSPEVVVTAYGDLTRDRDVYLAITEAANGVRMNADTPVDRIMDGANGTVSPQRFYDTFAATREALRRQYGDSVPAFRAEGRQKPKATKNWATTREFAAQFGDNVRAERIPVENILAVNVTPNGKYHELIVGKPPVEAAAKAPESPAERPLTLDPIDAPPAPLPTHQSPAEAAAQHFLGGGTFRTILEARKFVREIGGADMTDKAVEEAIEAGVVRAARQIAAADPAPHAVFEKLVDLYNRQPNLSSRTSKSMAEQAYSTPAPLAYVASRLAGIDAGKTVLEPTAGNGMLLMQAAPERTLANEIDDTRRGHLAAQGFEPSSVDATTLNLPRDFDVVIANPPFGAVRENGVSTTWSVDGLNTTNVDHAISLKALDAMKDDGRAVLIIGGVKAESPEERAKGYIGQAKRKFFNKLLSTYNVVDHFTVEGDLYSRQGAGWPVDVIVIHGRGKSARKPPSAQVPQLLKSWAEVKEKLNGVADNQTALRPPASGAAPSVRPSRPTGERPAAGPEAVYDGLVREPTPASEPVEREPVADVGPALGAQPDRGEPGAVRGSEPVSGGAPVRPETVRESAGADRRPDPDGRRPVDPRDSDQFYSSDDEDGWESIGWDMSARRGIEVSGGVTKAWVQARLLRSNGTPSDVFTWFKNHSEALDLGLEFSSRWTSRNGEDDEAEISEREQRMLEGLHSWAREQASQRPPEPRPKPQPRKIEQTRPVAPNAAGQTPYAPASEHGAKLGTLIPANLADPVADSLRAVEARHGPVSEYVSKALAYKADAEGPYFIRAGKKVRPFSAEQIDALALAIDNVERGAAVILGDQTGIGKGRVVAGAISYAHSKGMVPVFVTEKPDLYGDMWRDLHDIGFPEKLGREVSMFMTNSGARVPLDDEAVSWVAEAEQAKTEGQPIPERRGEFTAPQSVPASVKGMQAILAGTKKPDVVFTTYDQMNSIKGGETERREFLRQVAPKSFLILDEAHNAGGQGQQEDRFVDKMKAPPRAEVFREALGKAQAALYSSATWAKSPKVMDLFNRTDILKAVDDPKDLADLIAKGGVPLQQAVSSMLARGGQYIRRERSFEGVEYAMETAPVDAKAYGDFTEGLRDIFEFDRFFSEERSGLAQTVAMENGYGTTKDGGLGDAAANSTEFAAVMHNAIAQMITSIKAEAVAQRAITALKAGEKPIITFSQTMESFIKDFAEGEGLKAGDPIELDFGAVLARYLERARRITVKNGDEKVHLMIPLAKLSGAARALHDKAAATLNRIDLSGLPISPLDWIRHRIAEAGYSVREVTGRKVMVDYGHGTPTLVARPTNETGSAGKRVTIKGFNDGTLDAAILNKSGSTGVSMHASAAFKDQRRRRMIIAAADPNIDTHMQMLGRPHRTGQVIPPAYSQIAADIPAETRPAAVLMKKMASLNANTTAARKSAFTGEAVDFMNEYGDRVVAAILDDDHALNYALGEPVKRDQDGVLKWEGSAAKATGRLTLLKPEQQREFLDRVTEAYVEKMRQLDEAGENKLEAKSLDLQARHVESQTLKPPSGPSPFEAEVRLDKINVKAQGRAMHPEEAVAFAKEAVGGAAGKIAAKDFTALSHIEHLARQALGEQTTALNGGVDAYVKERLATFKEADSKSREMKKVEDAFDHWKKVAARAPIGAVVRLDIGGESMPAVVTGFVRAGRKGNPAAGSNWQLTFAVPNSMRQVSLPLGRISLTPLAEDEDGVHMEARRYREDDAPALAEAFEAARKEGREDRYVVGGNILAGYDMTKGRGQIATYSMEDGSQRMGILMPRGFQPKKFLTERALRFKTGAQVMEFLGRAPGDGEIASTDGVVTVRKANLGAFEFDLPAARGKGGVYFTDKAVRAVFDGWEKKGSRMRATLTTGTARKMIDAMQQAGAVFETTAHQDLADQIINAKTSTATAPQLAPPSLRPDIDAASPERQAEYDAAEQIARQLMAEMLPEGAVRLEMHDDLIPMPDGTRATGTYTTGTLEEDWTDSTGRTRRKGDVVSRVIGVSRLTDDILDTVYHEAHHALEEMGAVTKAEMAVMQREKERLRRLAATKYDPEFMAGQSDMEVRAFASGAYNSARRLGVEPPWLHPAVKRAFERVYRIIRRLQNLWRSKGFLLERGLDMAERLRRAREHAITSEDVFDRMRAGEMQERFVGTEPLLPDDIRHMQDNGGNFLTESWAQKPYGPKTAPTLAERGKALQKKLGLDDLRRAYQDFNAPIEREQKMLEDRFGTQFPADRDLYHAKRLLPGRAFAETRDAERQFVKPLIDAMAEGELTLDDMDNYLLARHAPERNALMDQRDPGNMGAGSGITDAQARDALDELGREGKLPALERAAALHDALQERKIDIAVEAGLMSDEQAEEWRQTFAHYADLRGWEDPDLEPEAAHIGRVGKMAVRGRESQQALGRKSLAHSPTTNAIEALYRTIQRAERNRALDAGWRMFKALPKADIADVVRLDRGKMVRKLDEATGLVRLVPEPVPNDRTVSFKIGGAPHHMIFESKDLADTVNRVGADALGGVMKFIYNVNSLRKAAWTHWNPEFVLGHFFARYPLETALNAFEHGAKSSRAALKGYPGGKAMRAILKVEKLGAAERAGLRARANLPGASEADKWAHFYNEMREAGGVVDFRAIDDLDTIRNSIERTLAAVNAGRTRAAFAYVRQLYAATNAITSAMDNALRLAVYRDARERLGKAPKDAALMAREASVDFSLRGEKTNAAAVWRGFFNVGVQTGAQLHKRFSRSGRFRKVVYGMVGLGVVMSLFNYIFGGVDEKDGVPWIEGINDYARQTKFTLMLPGTTDAHGAPYALSVPFPYGFMAPLQIGQLIGGLMMKAAGVAHEPVGQMISRAAEGVIEAFVPLGQEHSWLGMFLPDISHPFLHVATNRNTWGAPLHQSFPKKGLAHAEQGRSGTPDLPWGMIARGLNMATGGDHYTSGLMDLYPEDYRETLGDLTSSFERIGSRGARALESGESASLTDIPLVHQFVAGGTRQYEAADRQRFYEKREQANGVVDAYERMVKDRDPGAAAFRAAHAADIQQAEKIKSVDKLLRGAAKQKDAIRAAVSLSEAEKAERIRAIDEASKRIMRGAVQ